MTATKKQYKFLLGEYSEENRIGDLVLLNLQKKYFGYNFILRSPRFIYLLFNRRVLIWSSSRFDKNLSLGKVLEIIFRDYIIKSLEQKKGQDVGLDFLIAPGLVFG